MNDTIVNPKDRAKFVYAYLSQGQVWFPKDRPKIQITDMDLSWRRNAANWLVRRAPVMEFSYTEGEVNWLESGCGGAVRELLGHDENGSPVVGGPMSMMLSGEMACDAFEREQDARAEDPAAWIQTTPLYRALVAGAGDGE